MVGHLHKVVVSWLKKKKKVFQVENHVDIWREKFIEGAKWMTWLLLRIKLLFSLALYPHNLALALAYSKGDGTKQGTYKAYVCGVKA
jgi:hypothetical protein